MKNLLQTELPMFLGDDFNDTDLPKFLCRCGEVFDRGPADRAKSLDETGPDEPKTSPQSPS
jgi:hypothetical protein